MWEHCHKSVVPRLYQNKDELNEESTFFAKYVGTWDSLKQKLWYLFLKYTQKFKVEFPLFLESKKGCESFNSTLNIDDAKTITWNDNVVETFWITN